METVRMMMGPCDCYISLCSLIITFIKNVLMNVQVSVRPYLKCYTKIVKTKL
jgi:hypothetical protein